MYGQKKPTSIDNNNQLDTIVANLDKDFIEIINVEITKQGQDNFNYTEDNQSAIDENIYREALSKTVSEKITQITNENHKNNSYISDVRPETKVHKASKIELNDSVKIHQSNHYENNNFVEDNIVRSDIDLSEFTIDDCVEELAYYNDALIKAGLTEETCKLAPAIFDLVLPVSSIDSEAQVKLPKEFGQICYLLEASAYLLKNGYIPQDTLRAIFLVAFEAIVEFINSNSSLFKEISWGLTEINKQKNDYFVSPTTAFNDRDPFVNSRKYLKQDKLPETPFLFFQKVQSDKKFEDFIRYLIDMLLSGKNMVELQQFLNPEENNMNNIMSQKK